MPERRMPILAVPLLLAALAVPIWVGYEGARAFLVARGRIARALPVEATVVATSVESRRGGRGGLSYLPRVRYRYVVRDTTYFGERTTVLDLSSTRGWAEGVAGQFHPGQTVTAYYDPDRPDQAFLVPTIGGLPLALIAVAVLWLGAFSWLVRRRLRRPDREPAGP
jgi:hypothetical protein